MPSFFPPDSCPPHTSFQSQKLPEPGTKESEKFLWTMPYTCIELTHNHGTESVRFEKKKDLKRKREHCALTLCAVAAIILQDASFKYDSGNNEPKRGFGHIAVFTDDVYKSCENLEAQGVSAGSAGPVCSYFAPQTYS